MPLLPLEAKEGLAVSREHGTLVRKLLSIPFFHSLTIAAENIEPLHASPSLSLSFALSQFAPIALFLSQMLGEADKYGQSAARQLQ